METNGVYSREDVKQTSKSVKIDEETRHFLSVVHSFQSYLDVQLHRLSLKKVEFDDLKRRQPDMMPEFDCHFKKVEECLSCNQEFIDQVVASTAGMFTNFNIPEVISQQCQSKYSENMSKVETTLRQLIRDWSKAGSIERLQSYDPVIAAVKKYVSFEDPAETKILIPGAGLGRLVFEFAKEGFNTQGNEMSAHMLFAANVMLNIISKEESVDIFPYVHQWTNVYDEFEQIRCVSIPDVIPSQFDNLLMSMSAGEFVGAYEKDADNWDSVATVFFLDTAENPLEYVQTIYRILKPGGIWVNLGPLLWHHSDMPGHSSVDMSWSMLKKIISNVGFECLEETFPIDCAYVLNECSMLRHQYRCVFSVFKKPA